LYFDFWSDFFNDPVLIATIYDPKVIYDSGADRFVLVVLHGSNAARSKVLVAFSKTNNPRGHQLEMIDVNVRAVVDLTNRLLPELRKRGGAVINIASTAAFQPTAYLATYGATKAFVLHWSLALNEELRGSGVRALAVCPGPTSTEFFKRAGLKQSAVSDRVGQTCDDVIETTLRALASGRAQVVSGWGNWFVAAFSSRLPKPWAARVGAAILAKFRMSRVSGAAEVAKNDDGGAK
jgi:short-subunit dehydrogenase